MNRRELFCMAGAMMTAGGAAGIKSARAQVPIAPKLPAGEPNRTWLDAAEALKPVLRETAQSPIALVEAVPDLGKLLRFDMRPVGDAASLGERSFAAGDSLILDFGGHRTGYLSFRLRPVGRTPDAPVRLRLTFGEVPTDVAEPLYPYQGTLSAAWLPDEVVTIDFLPQDVRLPRRHAFRYVKIEVIAASRRFSVAFDDVCAHAVTAAGAEPPPPESLSPLLARIDAVAVATLRDCLQTTFEDGPRRDQRLWLGDLRLQALANYATFRSNDVVKRCLYLFAALRRSDGLVNACVFEKPAPAYGDTAIFDYAALFGVTLAEYVEASGDRETGRELWPVATRQIELLCASVGTDGLFVDPGDIFLFIDWRKELDRTAAIQGVLIFAMRRMLDLAALIGRGAETTHYAQRIARMTVAARSAFYDPASQTFVSGPDRQISWASQAWLTIAGVPASETAARRAIRSAMTHADAVRPATPYLYHYVVEAMIACGMRAEALALMQSYWGGMVRAGADTFWEVYDPGNPLSSPYGDIHIDSYCHAWSCTPSYFLRTLGLGQGKAMNGRDVLSHRPGRRPS